MPKKADPPAADPVAAYLAYLADAVRGKHNESEYRIVGEYIECVLENADADDHDVTPAGRAAEAADYLAGVAKEMAKALRRLARTT